MIDPRISKLADVLINYSCAVQPGEKLLIEGIDIPPEVICELVKTARKAGADPLVTLKSHAVWRALINNASEEQMALIADTEAHRMSNVQAYIGFRGNLNITEWADIPKEKMKLYEKHVWQRVHHDIRVKKTKWVVLRWPNGSMAQSASMSTEAFEDFYFDVCTLDYSKMDRAMQPLVELMNETDRVRLVAPGTDLTFSIKGIPAISCAGRLNIPDGEVFTAPVKDSVNGPIRFNARAIYHGRVYDDIRLVFRDGKIVEATSSDTEALNKVLDTDPGARYVGEFALGFNPYITKPMLDTLFDEKIAGSIHFTPGACYDEAPNGNKSEIHWDMVLLMAEEDGGGEIHFDDKPVRKDGRFVIPELEPLNPENLR